jgi:hypothetical protein
MSANPPRLELGCQMAYFSTKDFNFGKFFKALEWKMLVYFMATWFILCLFGIAYYYSVIFCC